MQRNAPEEEKRNLFDFLDEATQYPRYTFGRNEPMREAVKRGLLTESDTQIRPLSVEEILALLIQYEENHTKLSSEKINNWLTICKQSKGEVFSEKSENKFLENLIIALNNKLKMAPKKEKRIETAVKTAVKTAKDSAAITIRMGAEFMTQAAGHATVQTVGRGMAAIQKITSVTKEQYSAKTEVQKYLKKCMAAQKENAKLIVNYVKKIGLSNVNPKKLIADMFNENEGFPTAGASVAGEILNANLNFKNALIHGMRLKKIHDLLKDKNTPNAAKLNNLYSMINTYPEMKNVFIEMNGGLVSKADYEAVMISISDEINRLKEKYDAKKGGVPQRQINIAQQRIDSMQKEFKFLEEMHKAGLLTRDLLIERLTQLKKDMRSTRIFASTGAMLFGIKIEKLKHQKLGPKFWDTFGQRKSSPSQFFGRGTIMRSTAERTEPKIVPPEKKRK